MTDTYKATPEQWQASKRRAANGHITDLRLLELRARVEALEAQASNYPEIPDSSTPPPVATDEEIWGLWAEFGFAAFRIIYNLGIEHGQASSREVADPAPVAGGLVARVVDALVDGTHEIGNWSPEARAAILEVAGWLYERSWNLPADLLKREAGR